MSTGPLNSAAPTTAFIIGGVYNVTSPAPAPGQALPLQIDANGNILVNIAAGAASGTQYADGTTQVTPTGTVALGKNPTNVLHSLSLDASGNLNVNVAVGGGGGVQFADNAVSGATPTGTLAMGWDSVNSKVRALKVDANQNLDVIIQNATLAVTQSTSPWVVSLTSTAITGTVAVTQSTSPWTIQGDSASVTQSTSPWVVNITQLASTVLGTPQTFGTAPTGVVIGTSSDIYAAGTRVRSNQTTTAAGVVDVNVAGILGVTAVAAAAGIQKVGISGAAAATLDAVITAATAPANALATLVVNNTTPPSLTTGQSVMAQCDYEGSLFVKPIRRAQTVSKPTTITNSAAATTVLAAQAAGIFADIAKIVMTVIPIAGIVAETTFTATLSDGTNSYIFDMDAGDLGSTTVPGTAPTNVNISFNPPLPATTAATAWTVALSVSTVTVHITTVAILQKVS